MQYSSLGLYVQPIKFHTSIAGLRIQLGSGKTYNVISQGMGRVKW